MRLKFDWSVERSLLEAKPAILRSLGPDPGEHIPTLLCPTGSESTSTPRVFSILILEST